MTHQQLVKEWKEKSNKRFVWKHSPEGRGYLYDIEGCQTVDEVIMFDFAERFALAAAKGAAEETRLAITKTVEELESRGQLFNGTDSISRQETYTAISQSEENLRRYFLET